MPPRTVRLCRWRLRSNALWLWWYCAMVLAAQAFLLYRAVGRCRRYNELRWSAAQRPVGELYAFIVLIVVSVTCLPFFVVAALFKVGNYASDGARLGRDPEAEAAPEAEVAPEAEMRGARAAPWTRRAWRHAGPVSCGLHVVAAFALLLPRVFLQAQEIHHGLLHRDAVWSSEQDGFRASPIMPGEWRRGDVTSGAANATLSGVVPAAAAGVGTGSAGVAGVGLSPEFVNYLLALAFYNVRYAAVFWHAKALFSLLFSLQLFVASLHFVLAYCGMAVLYKLRLNARLFATTTTTTTALPAGAVMTLYLAAAAVVFMSPIAVFNYGHAHYERAYRKMAGQARGWRGRAAGAVGCHGYAPHCVAAAALVALVALRAPLVYDCVAVYRATGHALLLAVTVVDAVYMLCWIGTWTALTVKQTWAFHVDQSAVVTRHAPAVARGNGHVTRRSDALSPATSSLRKSTERRHHATSPRVTFTDAMGAPPGGEEESGGRERGRDEGVVRRAGARAAAKPRPLSDSSLDQGQPRCWLDWAATPDNTLTRDYRHSIRHKCDEYYRHSVEGASPPAAHSSPVTMRRQRQLMLPPMVHSAPAAVGLDGYARQHGLSPIEAAADGLPPYATVRRRRPPAESTPEIADAKRHNRTLSGFYGAPAKPRRSFATQNVRAQATMLATTAPGHAAPDAGPARPGILRLAPVSPPAGKPPRPRAAPSILKSGGVTRKPELYRRDSALPSSNETSSNDSSDVLCSQV